MNLTRIVSEGPRALIPPLSSYSTESHDRFGRNPGPLRPAGRSRRVRGAGAPHVAAGVCSPVSGDRRCTSGRGFAARHAADRLPQPRSPHGTGEISGLVIAHRPEPGHRCCTARPSPKAPGDLSTRDQALANRSVARRGGRAKGAAPTSSVRPTDVAGGISPPIDVALPGRGGLRDDSGSDGAQQRVIARIAAPWHQDAPRGTGARAGGGVSLGRRQCETSRTRPRTVKMSGKRVRCSATPKALDSKA